MRPITIWFNKSGLSNYAVIESIKASAAPGETFRFIVTHSKADFTLQAIADVFVVEPTGVSDAEYVDWCVAFAAAYKVDAFFPDKGGEDIADRRAEFEALGVHVMMPLDAATLRLIDHKGRQYEAIGEGVVPIPEYRIVNTLAEFEAACADLKLRHERICFKPAVSIFGAGYRSITDEGSSVGRLFNNNNTAISMAEARFIFGQEERFRDLMVMEYLPGPEFSVDCLAVKGEVVSAIVRVKTGDRIQELPENPYAVMLAKRLARRLNLDGLFNAQFRNNNGELYLLEVNARMSGGLYVTFHSGVSLPYWAVKLAVGTGTAGDIPTPATGVKVGQMHRSVTLPNS